MALLIITPIIRAALERLPESTRKQLSLPAPELNAPISHTQLITLSQNLASYSYGTSAEQGGHFDNVPQSYTLNDLVRGTKIYVPPPPPKPEPTPEYVALMAKLDAEAQARKYSAMLDPQKHNPSAPKPSPIFASPSPSDMGSNTTPNSLLDSGVVVDDDPLTPSVAINILVSILFTGFATYWALSNFRIPHFLTFSSSRVEHYPGSLSSQPFRVFLSMFLAIVVGVAEVVVYAAYLKKVAAAKEKEKKMVEKKTVIGEYTGDSHSSNTDGSVPVGGAEEKVEIWGKGVNGGARRRIKERWKARENSQGTEK
ncbi:hypothetical protein VTO42DRAFT_963 [Malbranchea cinnamomea]